MQPPCRPVFKARLCHNEACEHQEWWFGSISSESFRQRIRLFPHTLVEHSSFESWPKGGVPSLRLFHFK